MPLLKALAFALLIALPGRSSATTCTVVSASLCVGPDDIGDAWINGNYIGSYPYTTSGLVTCRSVNPAFFNASGVNVIALRVSNTMATLMWGSWALAMNCAGGALAYETNLSAAELYHDPSGGSPPPLQAGLNWYESAYVPSPPWGPPILVTSPVYGRRALFPPSGVEMDPVSWDSVGSGPDPAAKLYFRQSFSLIPENTVTVTSTRSPTPTVTPTITPSATASQTPTVTATSTVTETFSHSPSSTITATYSVSPTVTPTPSITETHTISPTLTISPTMTVTRTPFLQTPLLTLKGLYPNPFEGQASLVYGLRTDARLRLQAYNVAGEPVYQADWQALAGLNEVTWKGQNDAGANCASGVYLLRLEASAGLSVETEWATAVIVR